MKSLIAIALLFTGHIASAQQFRASKFNTLELQSLHYSFPAGQLEGMTPDGEECTVSVNASGFSASEAASWQVTAWLDRDVDREGFIGGAVRFYISEGTTTKITHMNSAGTSVEVTDIETLTHPGMRNYRDGEVVNFVAAPSKASITLVKSQSLTEVSMSAGTTTVRLVNGEMVVGETKRSITCGDLK